MKIKIKKGAMFFGIRCIIFLLLSYLVIPFFISTIANLLGLDYTVRYRDIPFALYALILIFAFLIYERNSLLNIDIYKQKISQTVIFSFISLFFYFSYFLFFHVINPFSLGSVTLSLVLIYVSYFLGSLFLFLAIFQLDFVKRYKKSLILIFILSIIFFSLTVIIRRSWTILSFIVAKVVYQILSWFYPSARILFDPAGYPLLGIEDFQVGIGEPCSGIDSLTMFISLFVLVLVLDYNKLNKVRVGMFFILGLLGTFFMNILRIFSLMIIGISNPEFAIGMFHDNAGGVLFMIFILIMLYFGYPFMKKNK